MIKHRAPLLVVVALFSLAAAPRAHAHVEPGLYVGRTAQGAPCAITAVRQYYVDDVHHPLNERVVLRLGQTEFTVAHPPVVDVATHLAYFNHDVFQASLPTPKGSRALVIDMRHQGAAEGPVAFHAIDHQWNPDVRTAVHCLGLQRTR